ncbi:MAG: hypothetical protein WDO73_29880 [Ignavibacteriota bacterium]
MTLQLQQQGLTGPQLFAMGAGPSKFTIQAGEPYVSIVRRDVAPFIQDDLEGATNFTLSLGLRYENQNLISDNKDVAPRVGFRLGSWLSQEGTAEDGHPRRRGRVLRSRVVFGFRSGILEQRCEAIRIIQSITRCFYPNIPSLSSLEFGHQHHRPGGPQVPVGTIVCRAPSASSANCRTTPPLR